MSSSQMINNDPAVISVAAINGAYTGTITYTWPGYGYVKGTTFVIKGTVLGGASPANDLTLIVSTVNSYGGITALTQSGTGTNTGVYLLTLDLSNNYRFERDASDATRALRERLIYNEKRAGTNIGRGVASLVTGRPQATPAGVNHLPAGNAELLWQQQGNNFRLAYLFGKLKCGAGFGGAFNLNGPNSFTLTGAQSGS